MSALSALLLLVAGFGAGLAGTVVGLASLVSYPALLGVGLPPVTANVTNTVALTASGVGSTLGSRLELRGQLHLVRRVALAAVLGGIVGAVLLLRTPAGAFEQIVPWLIAAASLAILFQPWLRRLHGERDPRTLTLVIFLISIYGGYFGAAAGVLMLAALLAMTTEPLPRANAVKNVCLGLANAVAAVAFILFGPVTWAAVLPLAAGCLAGSRLGPVVVRHAPGGPLRLAIAFLGFLLAARLAQQAYG